ncbi:hypothetical protein ABI_12700 [Asticcacaulis biprosthecium C19]|uniref:Uncharacterized protein n=1 Tax=Asticcacaulis biprosthecium C19 TaxID=715226 RepID=F4QHU6_9CAUL|nr:hypothetical protein ABI_12700 [Asticcacaulis biprosthecium C19]
MRGSDGAGTAAASAVGDGCVKSSNAITAKLVRQLLLEPQITPTILNSFKRHQIVAIGRPAE